MNTPCTLGSPSPSSSSCRRTTARCASTRAASSRAQPTRAAAHAVRRRRRPQPQHCRPRSGVLELRAAGCADAAHTTADVGRHQPDGSTHSAAGVRDRGTASVLAGGMAPAALRLARGSYEALRGDRADAPRHRRSTAAPPAGHPDPVAGYPLFAGPDQSMSSRKRGGGARPRVVCVTHEIVGCQTCRRRRSSGGGEEHQAEARAQRPGRRMCGRRRRRRDRAATRRARRADPAGRENARRRGSPGQAHRLTPRLGLTLHTTKISLSPPARLRPRRGRALRTPARRRAQPIGIRRSPHRDEGDPAGAHAPPPANIVAEVRHADDAASGGEGAPPPRRRRRERTRARRRGGWRRRVNVAAVGEAVRRRRRRRAAGARAGGAA